MSATKLLNASEAINQGLVQDVIKAEDIPNFIENYTKKITHYSMESIVEVKSLLKSALLSERNKAFRAEAELFGKSMEREGSKKIQAFFESKQKTNDER